MRKEIRQWRSRLVGRGRTTGNRVAGNTVREFESLLLRQTGYWKTAKATVVFRVKSVRVRRMGGSTPPRGVVS